MPDIYGMHCVGQYQSLRAELAATPKWRKMKRLHLQLDIAGSPDWVKRHVDMIGYRNAA